MSKNKKEKSRQTITIILIAAFVAVTMATCGIAIFLRDGFPKNIFKPKENSEMSESVSVPNGEGSAGVVPSSPTETELPKIPLPDEVKAGTLKAGREIILNGDNEETKSGIDKYLNFALESGLNAVVIDTAASDGRLIYNTLQGESFQFSDSFSPISYTVDKAHELGLYTMVIFYATPNNFGEYPVPLEAFNNQIYENISKDISNFTKSYKCDTLLIDGYYYPKSDNGYLKYLNAGAATNFESFERDIPLNIVKSVREATLENKTCGLLGVITQPQWLSSLEGEGGSSTTDLFSCMTDGNTDIFSIHDTVPFDIAAVKAFGSTDDTKLPFVEVSSWWAKKLYEKEISCIIIHAAHKAVTDEVGWTEYDQLSRQVIDARKQPNFGGSIFDSLQRMEENPKEFATKLVGYYGGTVKEKHIMTDLDIISPTTQQFTSFNSQVAFSGNTDPNTDATINGVKIKTDENGYFSLMMELKEGVNTFEVVHKGKTKVYSITRVIEVVKNVSPVGVLNVDGSTKLTITAEAYAEAQVYAVVGGQNVPMFLDKDGEDESLRNTSYAKFKGIYTIPDATTTVQNLGCIVVYGKWGDIEKSKKGASVKINARALPSDGKPVVVTADMAETFPADTASAYSDPNYFPIPKGSLDYAVGSEIKYSVNDRGQIKTYSFFKLASGLRVLSGDIATVSSKNAPVGNKITGVTVTADQRHTKVILATKQQVSFKAKYSSNKITFLFHYTDSTPKGMALNQNPLFDNLSFNGAEMTLELKNSGIFFGYTAYYDDSGNLVLRFNNPPPGGGSDLSGTKIVIDPGHGGIDTGALGYLGTHPEKVINWSIATKLESVLTSRGATVVKLPTQTYNYTLEERVKMAQGHDPHLFISVHSNSSSLNTGVKGTEAYYFNPFSYAFAQYTAQNVANSLGTANRGGKFGYYYVSRSMQYPAILVECGFLTNPGEYNKLIDGDYQSAIATAIANSMGSYIKLMGKNVDIITGTQVSGSMNNGGGGGFVVTPDDSDVTSESEATTPSGKAVLTLSDTNLTLGVDESVSLFAQVENADTSDILWKISKNDAIETDWDRDSPDVLSIYGLDRGTVKIVAYLKGQSSVKATCTVTVK